MPPIVIDIRNAEDARDVVHRAVQALAEGQLVAFPTETVYGLGAEPAIPMPSSGCGSSRTAAGTRRSLSPSRAPKKRSTSCPTCAPGPPAGPPLLAGPGDARRRQPSPRRPRRPTSRQESAKSSPPTARSACACPRTKFARRAADAGRPDRAHQRQPQRRARSRHRRGSRASGRRQTSRWSSTMAHAAMASRRRSCACTTISSRFSAKASSPKAR